MQIEEVAKNVRAQPLLVQSGFVGLLKGFLEPLQTAKVSASGHNLLSLPHLQVRNMVYQLLGILPISTHSQEGRNTLRSSNIGPVLRFYAQVRHEKESNRRFVNDLLNRWMSPIIEEGRKANRDADVDRAREEVLMPSPLRLKFPSQHRCLMSGLCTVLHLRRPSTELCVAPGFRNAGLWPCTLEHTCSEYDTPLLFAAIVGLSVRAGHSITRHATDNVPVHIIT